MRGWTLGGDVGRLCHQARPQGFGTEAADRTSLTPQARNGSRRQAETTTTRRSGKSLLKYGPKGLLSARRRVAVSPVKTYARVGGAPKLRGCARRQETPDEVDGSPRRTVNFPETQKLRRPGLAGDRQLKGQGRRSCRREAVRSNPEEDWELPTKLIQCNTVLGRFHPATQGSTRSLESRI
jgi:hypothetical protein